MNTDLTKQSQEVMTVVETFYQNETIELIYDNDQLEKWNNIVVKLGLTGQKEISSKEKSPVPFMHLKQTLVNVFETLCPRKVDFKSFNINPIPVEILDAIALSVREEYFDKIEIWYDDKSPDPIAIGLRYANEESRKKGYSWQMEKYILGKWGDVKRTFEELTCLAKIRFKAEQTTSLKENIKRYTRQLEDIDEEIENKFGTNNTSDFPF